MASSLFRKAHEQSVLGLSTPSSVASLATSIKIKSLTTVLGLMYDAKRDRFVPFENLAEADKQSVQASIVSDFGRLLRRHEVKVSKEDLTFMPELIFQIEHLVQCRIVAPETVAMFRSEAEEESKIEEVLDPAELGRENELLREENTLLRRLIGDKRAEYLSKMASDKQAKEQVRKLKKAKEQLEREVKTFRRPQDARIYLKAGLAIIYRCACI